MAETRPWDAQAAGKGLLADVTAAIAAGRGRAAAMGRIASDADLARAVLASPAMADSARATLDSFEGEYEPVIAAMIGREVGQVIAEAAPAIRASAAEEIARAIEADVCTPGAECGDQGCRQALRDAGTARKIGGAP